MYQVTKLPVQSYLSITEFMTPFFFFNDGKIEQPKTIQALSYDAGVREQPKSLCKSICQRARPPHTTPPNPKPEPQQSISISSLHPDRVHQEQRHQRVSAIFITRSMMWAHNITSLPRSNLSVCLSLHLHSSVTPGGGCHRGNFVLSTVFSLSERFLSLLLTPSVSLQKSFSLHIRVELLSEHYLFT